ncbi:MAG: tRNA (adenosine(37)-N6)-threonylcarbamoyltransferase complex ATPase subunit type 1 TsaE [Sedimenticola sp.]|nr:tRNA (adenosine(37)-N6)-threonylcarbamoyltransferase complex ATPase subunit type 1 TsaE [Sedimenticola sp.]
MLSLIARSEQEQERIAATLAARIPTGCLIYLEGDLGAGKTTFARGLLQGLGHAGAVKSPTYTLIEPYEIAGRHCYHLDLYRLADPDELEFLGIRDLLQGDALLLVEWPERGGDALPVPDIRITISYRESGRQLVLEAKTALGGELLEWLESACGDKVNS